MVRFAINVYGRFSLNYFSRNVDNLLVGWRFNAQALGFYKKAYDLFAMSAVMQSLTSVAVSALRRLRYDAEKYCAYLVRRDLGRRFHRHGRGGGHDAGRPGRDSVPHRAEMGPRRADFHVLWTRIRHDVPLRDTWLDPLSVGRPDRWFRWGIIEFVLTALLFVLALPWGPVGIATMWSLSLCVLTLPAIWYAGRPVALDIGAIVASIWRFAAAGLGAVAATVLVSGTVPALGEATDAFGALARLVAVSIVFGGFYVSGVVLLHFSFTPILRVGDLLREMLPARGPAPVTVAAATVTVDD